MSFFGKFASFFEAVGKELEKLFGGGSFAQKVQAVITYVAPVVETIVQLAGGTAAATLVTNIINMIKSDLATVSTVVQGATVAAGTPAASAISTALASIETNLSSLLTAAEVKNSTNFKNIETAVNLVLGEVQALLANLPK
jgi:hypothetical protein